MKIDDIDLSILDELARDARLSMRELGKKVNLSPPSVTERVRRLESEGVITGYTIGIDRKKLGFGLECIMEVTVRNGDFEKFKAFAQSHPRVLGCWRTAGRACFFVRICAADLGEIEAFVNSIASYTSPSTHIVFSEVNIVTSLKEQLSTPTP
ncbi:Lrp/AsnC family transcriptional regulator [Paenibacillus ihbetae]|uniref:AsnC family transcriptional regulator n=1 Tax=Paenibacillus ihbetae TaxID=1870820 RepID=A0ABX3K0H1_9BACL|nr:Lrp/AsnC family transcriptional regulator [Paenibacillus ihbetae]OOC62943.1 AsnC family transcriptional regulator [Paenibacillus ihbetae]